LALLHEELNTDCSLKKQKILESPDNMCINRNSHEQEFLNWNDSDAVAFSILSKNMMFIYENGTHGNIVDILNSIVSRKMNKDEINKLFEKHSGFSFLGNKSKLTYLNLKKIIQKYSNGWDITHFPRKTGIAGRFWKHAKGISTTVISKRNIKKC
jgi:hypothetical protein